jgi:hypothetical protein
MQILLIILLILITSCTNPTSIDTDTQRAAVEETETYSLYVRIPEAITPLERVEKYEDPLNKFLIGNHLGEVTGGGTMLTADKSIEFVGIDVDVYNPEIAIPAIVTKLEELEVPHGTVIEQYEPVEREIDVWSFSVEQ